MSFDSYAGAQHAVDSLSDDGFPVVADEEVADDARRRLEELGAAGRTG